MGTACFSETGPADELRVLHFFTCNFLFCFPPKNTKMIIFKDILTDEEMWADTYKYKLVENGALYEVYGKQVTRKIGEDIQLAGSNPSAEEAEEGTEEAVESGVDIVLNQRLQEVCGLKKKDFIEYLKKYMKKILEKVPEDKKDEFKSSMQACSKMILGKFKDLQFFHGESFDYGIDERMLCMCEYVGEDPVMYFFKWGLEEEKV